MFRYFYINCRAHFIICRLWRPGLAIGYAVFRFARSLGADRLVSLFTAWLALFTPSILAQANSTNDEILAASILVTGLYFGWRWLSAGEEPYLMWAALAIGLSTGPSSTLYFLFPLFWQVSFGFDAAARHGATRSPPFGRGPWLCRH